MTTPVRPKREPSDTSDPEEAAERAFRKGTAKSAELHSRAAKLMPGGVSANLKFFRPYPIAMNRGAGGHIWDVDGNRYIDYHLCYGALIIGHGHRAVVEATLRQIRGDGTSVFGMPHRYEVEMAEAVLGLFPSAKQVRFTNSGLEATLLCLRLALAFTTRRRIAKFEGHYHGAHERVLVSYRPPLDQAGDALGPSPVPDSMEIPAGVLNDTLILPFNDWKATEALIRANARDLACVFVEPVQGGFIAPEDGFLERLAELTRSLGILLIFDEVKTGFRLSPGGAQALYGVEPDLTALGKILGGGFPAGAVVGRQEVLAVLSPSTRVAGNRVFHSGTYNGHPTAMAAGLATITELTRPSVFDRLHLLTEELKLRIAGLAASQGIDIAMPGVGSVFSVVFTQRPVRSYRDLVHGDARRRRILDLRLLARGVFASHGDRFSMSTAHSMDDVEETVKAFSFALARLV